MEELSSSYPYSMDWLIDSKDRSLVDFYKNRIVFLSFCGFGSASDIFNMTLKEIDNLNACMNDEEIVKLKMIMSGVRVE